MLNVPWLIGGVENEIWTLRVWTMISFRRIQCTSISSRRVFEEERWSRSSLSRARISSLSERNYVWRAINNTINRRISIDHSLAVVFFFSFSHALSCSAHSDSNFKYRGVKHKVSFSVSLFWKRKILVTYLYFVNYISSIYTQLKVFFYVRVDFGRWLYYGVAHDFHTIS